VPLAGRPLLTYALEAFRRHPAVSEIVLVVAPEDVELARGLLGNGPAHLTEKVVLGGAVRRDSVWHALQEVSPAAEVVLIHDAARPLVSSAIIDRCIDAIRHHGAAVVATPVNDTLKAAHAGHDESPYVRGTVTRDRLWAAQTPQGARRGLLLAAYERAIIEDWDVTDDASILERAGHRVHLVPGTATNFKVTRLEDLALAERLLMSTLRTGFGYDVHRLVEGRALILGGVTIPHALGLLGHSDADVLTHAVMDALLGAAALGDIGQHFPDTDPQYRGAASLTLLAAVTRLLSERGFAAVSVDVTLAAEAPKVAPHVAAMREHLAVALGLDVARVSVKATTTEGLGFVGDGAGMAAYAVATVADIAGVMVG
jgi:2-C-methyl-D-erythritol 4-phosphate cytidylyltransferase / 2-C-methyl-D-erythritol 2,4-cyclodiphosphate synthase